MQIGGWTMVGLIALAACAGSEFTRWRLTGDDPSPAVGREIGGVADPPVLARDERPLSRSEGLQRPLAPAVQTPAATTSLENTSSAPADEAPEMRRVRISEQFLAGALDAPRSTALAQAIASGDTALPDGTTIEDVRCRGSMCRMLARYSSPQLERGLIVALALRAGGSGQRVTVLHPENDEGSTAVIYLEESDTDGS